METEIILIVEDNDEDFELAQRALRKAGLGNKVMRCEDGDDALDYLYQRKKYADASSAPRPNVVLLDLNLPGTDGREVLEIMKKDDDLKIIPVIVLTTSNSERDINACYLAGANSYMQKPIEFSSYIEAIQRLKDYWFDVVIVPKAGK